MQVGPVYHLECTLYTSKRYDLANLVRAVPLTPGANSMVNRKVELQVAETMYLDDGQGVGAVPLPTVHVITRCCTAQG